MVVVAGVVVEAVDGRVMVIVVVVGVAYDNGNGKLRDAPAST